MVIEHQGQGLQSHDVTNSCTFDFIFHLLARVCVKLEPMALFLMYKAVGTGSAG